MGTTLTAAHNQWSTRPLDQRYWTLADMLADAVAYRKTACEKSVPWDKLEVFVDDKGELMIQGPEKKPAEFNHFSFGQMCKLVEAPASYLRTLPPELAQKNISHGMKNREAPGDTKLLIHVPNGVGRYQIHALTTDKYVRTGLWNDDVIRRIKEVADLGEWRTPPAAPAPDDPRARAATEADIFPGTFMKVGDMIGPAGLYRSDKDMFAFQINPKRPIVTGKSVLYPGFYAGNSHVGDRSFSFTSFWLNGVCQNHFIWGAERIEEIRVRHVGDGKEKAWSGVEIELRKYSQDPSIFTNRVKAAKLKLLGKTADEVFDTVWKMRINALTQEAIKASYKTAEEHREDAPDATPNSVWGFVQGVTRHSQQIGHMDDRLEVERAASKVFEVAF